MFDVCVISHVFFDVARKDGGANIEIDGATSQTNSLEFHLKDSIVHVGMYRPWLLPSFVVVDLLLVHTATLSEEFLQVPHRCISLVTSILA